MTALLDPRPPTGLVARGLVDEGHGVRLDYPDERECRWLVDQGVNLDSIAMPRAVRAAPVRFWQTTFDFDDDGERSLIFMEDRDSVAWQPRTGALACWRGVSFAINEDAINNPATYFAGGMLKVHRTPLEWLKADREGIVIVQSQFAYAYLRDARLVFDDPLHAERVKRWCRAPKPKTQFAIAV